MAPTTEQREIMRHALGLNRGSRDYRNHFVTGPGSPDYPHCEALVAAGLMQRRDGNPLSGGDPIYSVTEAGRAALKTPNAELCGGPSGPSERAPGYASAPNTEE